MANRKKPGKYDNKVLLFNKSLQQELGFRPGWPPLGCGVNAIGFYLLLLR